MSIIDEVLSIGGTEGVIIFNQDHILTEDILNKYNIAIIAEQVKQHLQTQQLTFEMLNDNDFRSRMVSIDHLINIGIQTSHLVHIEVFLLVTVHM